MAKILGFNVTKEKKVKPQLFLNKIKESKAEVVLDEVKWPKELGERHPYNYKISEGLYLKYGVITGLINKTVNNIWGRGFHTVSEDERSKKVIDDWMRDVNFAVLGRKWVKEALKKGTGYLELGGKKDEVPQGVKVLNSSSMWLKRDSKGRILKYNQYLGDVTSYKNAFSDKVTSFEPFEIAQLNINETEDCPYGLGMIYPALSIIENTLSNESDMQKIVSRKANVPIVAYLGSQNEGVEYNQSDIDDFGNKLVTMNARTEWVVPDTVRIEALNFGKAAENFEFVLEHDLKMISVAFETPQVLMGFGNIPEGLAKTQMDDYEKHIGSLQSEIEKVIEEKIFKRILLANGLDSHVEFEWGLPDNEEVNSRIKVITEVLKDPMLSEGLRSALEKEMANLFGFDIKDIESSGEERDCEEKEPQPIVPGQNELYEGEFKELCDCSKVRVLK